MRSFFAPILMAVGAFLVVSGLLRLTCAQSPIGAPSSRQSTLQLFDTSTAKGTWISSGSQHVGLFVDKTKKMPVIALENKAGDGPGHELALSLYKGNPTLQVVKDGEVIILDLYDAAKALQTLIESDGNRDPRTVGLIGAEQPVIVNQAIE